MKLPYDRGVQCSCCFCVKLDTLTLTRVVQAGVAWGKGNSTLGR